MIDRLLIIVMLVGTNLVMWAARALARRSDDGTG